MWMFIVGILAIVAYLLFLDVKKPLNYPKGPQWYPIIGNYMQFATKLTKLGYTHLVWDEFANEFGNLIGLKMGNVLVVAVNGPELIREVLTRDEFMGRPDGFFFKMRTFGKQIGIIFSEGSFWETQRKFTMFHLKTLGMGKQKMHSIIQEEAADLIKSLREQCSKGAVDMTQAFDVSVLNTLWALAAGERFQLNDDRLKYLVNIVHQAFTIVDASGGLINQMPFLRFIAPNMSRYNTIRQTINNIIRFIRESIKEHNERYDQDSPRDLMDMFIKCMKNKDETFSEEQLVSLCMDLFMAGAETTTNTLAFALLYLAKYPDIQRKVQLELCETIGTRAPTMQDKSLLPYTNAVLCEVQRIANVAPLGVPHKTTCDTILANYVVPKGTIVLTNLFSVHMDKELWGDPHTFRPERFLTEEGRLHIPESKFLPFGYGKRRCLGEMLAKANYFIMITTILQNFNVGKDPHGNDLNMNGRDGWTLTPQSAKLFLTPRFE